MNKRILTIFILCFTTNILLGQNDRLCSISGIVLDKKTNEPIPYAQVYIKGIDIWSFSDDDGKFVLNGVKKGDYLLVVSVLGYKEANLQFVLKDDIKNLRFLLLEDNLTLEEVVVTAIAGGSVNSSSKIDKKAIEHIQASSLSDIMQLLPDGIVENPNLMSKNTIQIRSLGDDAQGNNALGVGFIINGSKVSNDASRFSRGNKYSSSIDFRQYSTNNIESVEVLKGVVSAEYGDMTSGAVLVTTKAGRTPFEFGIKIDPKTQDISFNKGLYLGKSAGYFNISADYAKAFSDWRSPVNTYNRGTLSLSYSNTFSEKKNPFRLNINFSGNFSSNSVKSDPDVNNDDFTKIKNKGINGALRGNWMLNKSWVSSINLNISGNYNSNNSQYYVVTNQSSLPTTNIKESGVALGYFTELLDKRDMRVDDIPIYAGAKLSYHLNKKYEKLLIKTKAGIEWNIKGNKGDGEYYVGAMPQFFRQQRYSDKPFMSDYSAYIEENAIYNFNKKSSLEFVIGARLTKMKIKGYNYDPTIVPRLNIRYKYDNFTIRGGWGILEKLPTLNLLYPNNTYVDRATFQYRDYSNNESLALIHTTVIDNMLYYNLKTTKTYNSEVGIDFRINRISASITFFNERVRDGITSNSSYTSEVIRYYNPVSDLYSKPVFKDGKIYVRNLSGEYVEQSYNDMSEFISYSRPDNRAEENKWGIEYDIDFGKMEYLYTSVKLNGSYIKSNNYCGGEMMVYIGGQDPINSINKFPYVSIFNGSNMMSQGQTRDRLTSNLSFITNIPILRLVVTTSIQCIWMNRSWYNYDKGNIYALDIDGNKIIDDYSNKTNNQTLYRDPIFYMGFDGVVHPFSDYYNTTDGDLKRRLDMLRLSTDLPYYYAKTSYQPYFMANIRIMKEIGENIRFSFYANNFTNSKPILKNKARPNAPGRRFNSNIYFGAELKISF